MPLEIVHVEFDRGGAHFDVTFREQEGKGDGSVQINGRQYTIEGEDEQMAFVRRAVGSLSADQDTVAGMLCGRLKSQEGVENLRVLSSLSPAELGERMEGYVAKRAAEEGFRGAVLVKKGGERLVFRGYGEADETGRLNGVNTRFWLGSTTKQFTGVGIQLLIQDGTIPSAGVKINEVLPERFRNAKWSGVTVRHLLTHTSGIPSYGADSEDAARARPFSVDEIVALFVDKELEFPPGMMYRYSNGNYALLGAIIAEQSGVSYEEFMQARVFRGMPQTGTYASYGDTPSARGFVTEEGGEVKEIDAREMQIHISKAYAAGEVVSSLEDMERWDTLLYDESFLTPASQRELAQSEGVIRYEPTDFEYDQDEMGRALPREGVDYPRAFYGYGVGVGGDGEKLLHGGAGVGFTSFVARNTQRKECVIVLGNQTLSDGNAFMTETISMHLWEMLSW